VRALRLFVYERRMLYSLLLVWSLLVVLSSCVLLTLFERLIYVGYVLYDDLDAYIYGEFAFN